MNVIDPQLKNTIFADWNRYVEKGLGKPTWRSLLFHALSGKAPSFSFVFWLRMASKKNIFRCLAMFKWKRLSRKYGLQISYRTKIGDGLYIGHALSIVINQRTVIGRNFSISHMNSIGSDRKQYATIGDNVIMAPMSCIVNGCTIGNNSKIGAGAVVIKDVPDYATVVGVPAKVVKISQSKIQ